MPKDTVVVFATDEGRDIVKRRCRAAGVPIAVFKDLVEAELKQTGKKRKIGLWEDFDDILDRIEDV